jgi:hypothetical protein
VVVAAAAVAVWGILLTFNRKLPDSGLGHNSHSSVSCHDLSQSFNENYSSSLPLLPNHSGRRGCLFSLDHTQTHTTVGRISLGEGSARRTDLYLTTQTLYKKNIHAPGRIRTHDPSKRSAADLRAATGNCQITVYYPKWVATTAFHVLLNSLFTMRDFRLPPRCLLVYYAALSGSSD